MAMPEQFSLRWNDFHSNLSQSFQALLEGEDLVDVTLAAEGQYVHAHKLILSVCSPYFKELFKMNPCDHPIVILKDVAHQELRQLLQFMYRGEVHVRQQELSGFLHSAELLQVKGLTCGRERSESPPPVPEEIKPKVKPVIVETPSESQQEWVPGGEDTIATEAPSEPNNVCVKEEAARSPLKRLLKNTPNKNSYNVKKKSRQSNNSPTYPENSEYAYDGEPLIDFDNELFHSMVVLPESPKDSGWNIKKCVKCPSCHRFFANRYNLKVHIRDKHDTTEGTLQCDICQKRMRNPSCLRVHMYHHRKQAAYIAQLSTQHAIDTMVKWPNDQVIGCGDVDRIDSMVKWHNDQVIGGGEVDGVRIDSMEKWHNDQVGGGDIDNVRVPTIAVRRAEGSGGNSEPKDNVAAAAEPKTKVSANAQAKMSGSAQPKVSGNAQAKASGKAQANVSGNAQGNVPGNDHAVSGNVQAAESAASMPESDTETV